MTEWMDQWIDYITIMYIVLLAQKKLAKVQLGPPMIFTQIIYSKNMFSHNKLRKYSNKILMHLMIDYNSNKGPLMICNWWGRYEWLVATYRMGWFFLKSRQMTFWCLRLTDSLPMIKIKPKWLLSDLRPVYNILFTLANFNH